MRCKEIICGTNHVIVNEYLMKVHKDLGLIFDSNGVFIMDNSKILEFIPFSNILNVVNVSVDNENSFFVTYKEY